MIERVRSHDWAATPLGAAADWPVELKTTVGTILASDFPAAIVWGPQFTTIYNDAFRPLLGNKHACLGQGFDRIWAEAWDTIAPIARRAYAGQSTFISDFPLTINRNGAAEEAFFTFSYSPLRLSDGTIVGMIDTVMETTASVRARIQAEVLNHELGHRLKNTVAMMQSLVLQTLRDVPDRGAVAALMERVAAMGHAHDVLLASNWAAADLRVVAATVLAPHDPGDRFTLHGPPVTLGPRAVLGLSLMLHELATNAAKYGALSVSDGHVTLDWRIHDGELALFWRERDGPVCTAPARTGFGSRLIDRGLGRGRVSRRYPATGVEVDLHVPTAELLDG
ncbi:sensor histidine kinase [Sphingomonadaceae bacterium OTU29MARTA1]|nr:sensor histidine kinase [Sphingomonadaceae bacterium OTU29LAMAA1]USU09148.1 sensor histidine kinase [Sphingomonadaceae bacterium OTU29MARTA1]